MRRRLIPVVLGAVLTAALVGVVEHARADAVAVDCFDQLEYMHRASSAADRATPDLASQPS